MSEESSAHGDILPCLQHAASHHSLASLETQKSSMFRSSSVCKEQLCGKIRRHLMEVHVQGSSCLLAAGQGDSAAQPAAIPRAAVCAQRDAGQSHKPCGQKDKHMN